MNNPVLKWALQILQNPNELSDSDSVPEVLKLIGIDTSHILINSQPLESIFSTIALNDESTQIVQKKIGWQVLDTQQIVYPKEQVDDVTLEIPELLEGCARFYNSANLALALIEKYGTFLSISPAPHISFYDVVKTAAAIHDCLEGSKTDNPFLLVSGDFSGIQETIYTISSSGALKTLRARSFMLELLTEHIIYEIQQATSSERYSLIYSGGGGFSLLVPNTESNRTAINEFGKVINTWMLEQFGIQLFLALHCEPFSVDDLKERQFKDMWDLVGDKLGKQKQRKFWQSNSFKGLFHPKMPVHVENREACQITGRDDLPETEMSTDDLPGEVRVSKLAYRLWRLGDLLTDVKTVVRLKQSENKYKNGTLVFPTYQSEQNKPQYAEYVVNSSTQNNECTARWLINSWKLDSYDENTYPLLYSDYVRSVADLSKEAQDLEKKEYKRDHGKEMHNLENVTASFSGLAKASQGSELVGCLRMDVDNMGEFFSQGDLTLGLGIAANSNLSRSLNLFFKGYLNQICGMNLGTVSSENYPLDITGEKEKKKESGRDVSIVYAGGDDLFIAGAWDDIAELAFDINACFKAFTCQNPDINLSAGVTLHKPKFPLYQMARIAAEAEHTAKANKWDIGKEKNSLSLFYSSDLKTRNTLLNKRIEDEYDKYRWQQKPDRIAIASEWGEFADVIELTKQLNEIYEELPQGFYRRLFETLKIWQEDGKLYMPMLTHIIRKIDELNLKKPISGGLKTSLFQHIRQLHIPLHWVEYLNRQKGGDS